MSNLMTLPLNQALIIISLWWFALLILELIYLPNNFRYTYPVFCIKELIFLSYCLLSDFIFISFVVSVLFSAVAGYFASICFQVFWDIETISFNLQYDFLLILLYTIKYVDIQK